MNIQQNLTERSLPQPQQAPIVLQVVYQNRKALPIDPGFVGLNWRGAKKLELRHGGMASHEARDGVHDDTSPWLLWKVTGKGRSEEVPYDDKRYASVSKLGDEMEKESHARKRAM